MKKILIVTLIFMALLFVYRSMLPNRVYVFSGQSNSYGGKTGNDPSVSFAKEMGRVTIIKCGVGGSSINDWRADQYEFDECVNAVAGRDVAGVVFIQGEADTFEIEQAEQWDAGFEQFKTDWFDEFGEMPIVYATIGIENPDSAHYLGWDIVREAQSGADVDTSILTQDGLHYIADDDTTLGKMLAAAMLEQEKNDE